MVYLKQIAQAYKTVKDIAYDNYSVEFGHGKYDNKVFQLSKMTCDYENDYRVIYELVHYNTMILRVVYNFSTNHLIIQNGYGYSATDRNNINALLQEMGIKIIHASIKNECLKLNYNGKRVDEIIVSLISGKVLSAN